MGGAVHVPARAEVAVRPGGGRGPSVLREAAVVTDREAQPPAVDLDGRSGVAGCEQGVLVRTPEVLLVVRGHRRAVAPDHHAAQVRRPSAYRTAAPTTTATARSRATDRTGSRRASSTGPPGASAARSVVGSARRVGGWYAGRNSSGSTATRAPSAAARSTSRAAVTALPATSPGTGSAWTAATRKGSIPRTLPAGWRHAAWDQPRQPARRAAGPAGARRVVRPRARRGLRHGTAAGALAGPRGGDRALRPGRAVRPSPSTRRSTPRCAGVSRRSWTSTTTTRSRRRPTRMPTAWWDSGSGSRPGTPTAPPRCGWSRSTNRTARSTLHSGISCSARRSPPFAPSIPTAPS